MSNNEKLQGLFDAALLEPDKPSAAPLPSGVVPIPARAPVEPVSFDKEAADELGRLLDEKMEREKRKRSTDFVVTMCVIAGLVFCGIGWFVSNGKRVEAFQAAMADIRSVGDIMGIVGKFQNSLDRVAVRSGQIDQAASALGVDPTAEDVKDPYMQEEMKQIMGEDGGKTTAERNALLQQKFGKTAQEVSGKLPSGGNAETVKPLSKEDSFGLEP